MRLYVLVVLAALAVGAALSQLPADLAPRAADGFADGSCRPTPTSERYDVGPSGAPAFATPVRLVVGGSLAGQPQRSLRVGDYWHLRDPQRRPAISLRAERLDAPADGVTFTAIGYPLGAGFPREWAPANWYYRTAVDALETLPQQGCWRVSLVGGSARDSIVYILDDPRR